jgi:hypothetical protein
MYDFCTLEPKLLQQKIGRIKVLGSKVFNIEKAFYIQSKIK